MSSTPFSQLIEQAKDAKFVVIPMADYAIVCKAATAVKASTGKDMVKMTVTVIAGPHRGANVLTQQVLSPENPAAVAIFLKAMAAFGITEEFLASLPPREDGGPNMVALAAALQGKTAMAEVEIRSWQDEDRNDIKRFKLPNAEQEAAIKEALASFDIPIAAAASDPFATPAADPFAAAAAPEGEPF